MAVETPVVSSVGGQLVEVRTHDVGLGHSADGLQQLQKLTPPASGVPVPGKQEGSRQSRSMVR